MSSCDMILLVRCGTELLLNCDASISRVSKLVIPKHDSQIIQTNTSNLELMNDRCTMMYDGNIKT